MNVFGLGQEVRINPLWLKKIIISVTFQIYSFSCHTREAFSS